MLGAEEDLQVLVVSRSRGASTRTDCRRRRTISLGYDVMGPAAGAKKASAFLAEQDRHIKHLLLGETGTRALSQNYP